MKTFKKVFCFLLALVTVGCLCACEAKQDNPKEKDFASVNSEDTDSKPAGDTGNETAEPSNADYSFFDKEKYTFTQDTSSDHSRTTYTLIEKSDRQVPLEVTLAGKTITFNSTKISDLINSGWTLISGNKADSPVDSMRSTNAVVCAPNGKQATVYAANTTDSETAFSNCVIWNIYISYPDGSGLYNDKAAAADFTYSGNITSESSMKAIVQALGDPLFIYIDEYFQDGEYHYSTVTLTYRYNVEAEFSFRAESGSAKMTNAKFQFSQFKN